VGLDSVGAYRQRARFRIPGSRGSAGFLNQTRLRRMKTNYGVIRVQKEKTGKGECGVGWGLDKERIEGEKWDKNRSFSKTGRAGQESIAWRRSSTTSMSPNAHRMISLGLGRSKEEGHRGAKEGGGW